MTQLDRIEAMLAELLRRGQPPEGLGRLWAAFPWLLPVAAPEEPIAREAWAQAMEIGDL